jgi:RNA polymerase sigma-70 factor, ECF subfamily
VDVNNSPGLPCDKLQIEAWIEAAKGGSSAAIGQLLDACRDYLFHLANQRVSSPLRAKVSASDLVQETSLDAHRDFADFRGERLEELLAWLRRILLYNAANARRRYEVTGKRQVSREIPFDFHPAGTDQLKDNAPSPRSLLAQIEETQTIERALDRLPEDQRKVVVLRSREHLSFVEIGAQMERSAEAARKLWFRAVERLQQELVVPDELV